MANLFSGILNLINIVFKKWTESLIMWSPLGTYLATLHKQGVVLWGGPNFTNVLKLSHRNVQFVDFSPCEQ